MWSLLPPPAQWPSLSPTGSTSLCSTPPLLLLQAQVQGPHKQAISLFGPKQSESMRWCHLRMFPCCAQSCLLRALARATIAAGKLVLSWVSSPSLLKEIDPFNTAPCALPLALLQGTFPSQHTCFVFLSDCNPDPMRLSRLQPSFLAHSRQSVNTSWMKSGTITNYPELSRTIQGFLFLMSLPTRLAAEANSNMQRQSGWPSVHTVSWEATPRAQWLTERTPRSGLAYHPQLCSPGRKFL